MDSRKNNQQACVVVAETSEQYSAFVELATEYIQTLEFELDFQDVDHELLEAQSEYGRKGHGSALLAIAPNKEVVGIVGIRNLGAGRCELKRMYVRPEWRGKGIGRRLCEEAVTAARNLGYEAVRLDTLGRMEPAVRVYLALGFEPIPAYRNNPLPDAMFLELNLP